MTQPENKPRPHWTGAAIALLVIGLVVLVPSGLCTAFFGIMGLLYGSGNDALNTLSEALVFGGPFIAFGALFVFLGFRARKQN